MCRLMVLYDRVRLMRHRQGQGYDNTLLLFMCRLRNRQRTAGPNEKPKCRSRGRREAGRAAQLQNNHLAMDDAINNSLRESPPCPRTMGNTNIGSASRCSLAGVHRMYCSISNDNRVVPVVKTSKPCLQDSRYKIPGMIKDIEGWVRGRWNAVGDRKHLVYDY